MEHLSKKAAMQAAAGKVGVAIKSEIPNHLGRKAAALQDLFLGLVIIGCIASRFGCQFVDIEYVGRVGFDQDRAGRGEMRRDHQHHQPCHQQRGQKHADDQLRVPADYPKVIAQIGPGGLRRTEEVGVNATAHVLRRGHGLRINALNWIRRQFFHNGLCGLVTY